jgi:LacI family transcriptional regulator
MASTDVLAIGALHTARKMGLDVPGEISIVGFDDLPMAEYTTPALTTVRMPMAQMAAAGVEAAVDKSQDRQAITLRILKPAIVIRESSGPARPTAPSGT